MKLLRIYLTSSRPEEVWYEMPIPPPMDTLEHWVRVLQLQGFIMMPANWIPRESIRMMGIYEVPDGNNISQFPKPVA